MRAGTSHDSGAPGWLHRLGITGRRPRLGVAAPGVWRRRARLRALLGGDPVFVPLPLGAERFFNVDAIAGWGLKRDGRQRAERAGVPYLALEDAFLSRIAAPESEVGLLSVIADPVGVYYDASRPSYVEELIAAAPSPESERASRLMTAMRAHNLGKFNAAPDAGETFPWGARRPLVVVVDQIAGDFSIAGGGCAADDFARMTEAALDENPGADVVLRLHPYDGVGGRTGHLQAVADRYKLPTLRQDLTWMSIAKRAARVYVATSNAGLETLIAGAAVTCFGVPFYGGWGLTDDRTATPRRTARPSLEALVDAVYFQYAAYWDLEASRLCDALQFAKVLARRRGR